LSGPAPTHDYDVIVVLGGPVPAMRRRTAEGVTLYKAGRAPRILMSGRGRKSVVEAEAMAALARDAGVPMQSIFLEDRSRSTMENASFSARIMRDRGWRTALVVTDALHLPRALLAFRAAGVQARGSAAWPGWRREALLAWLAEAVYEAVALPWYLIRILSGRRKG
jgi:uncharacterized SAM-binding protein YcdF (DUF218 family)